MRASRALLRVPRRLASEVLQSAERNSTKSATPYFAEVPQVLKDFWAKYPPSPYRKYAEAPSATNAEDANPFLANKHPITNRWHKPKYSMRRQADIWKAAYRFGVEHLLPKLLHGRTFYEARYDSAVGPRGARLWKLTKGERDAPRRQKEVEEARAQLDDKIAKRKGKRFERFLEDKDRVGFV